MAAQGSFSRLIELAIQTQKPIEMKMTPLGEAHNVNWTVKITYDERESEATHSKVRKAQEAAATGILNNGVDLEAKIRQLEEQLRMLKS